MSTGQVTFLGEGGPGSGGGPAAGAPLAAQRPALVFGGATPDPVFLVGGDGEVQALGADRAAGADGLGCGDLADGRTGDADREEQVRIDGVTGGAGAPGFLDTPVAGRFKGQGHCVHSSGVDVTPAPVACTEARASPKVVDARSEHTKTDPPGRS